MTDLVEVDLGPGVRGAFTTVAHGNVSGVVGDRAAGARARAGLEARFGAPVVWLDQVHGVDVLRVDDDVHPVDPDQVIAAQGLPAADGAATGRADVSLAVVVADCVPVLLADPDARVVAAVHAGRRGLLAGVLDRALDAMVEAGADVRATRAAVGPAVCGRCYEVPAELRAEAEARFPGVGTTTSWGTPALDLPGAASRVLERRGVTVTGSPGCTLEEPRWFSHRAVTSGAPGRVAGRTAAVVRLLPE